MYNLTTQDKQVLATLRPTHRYPLGRRTVKGIAEQTGLDETMVEAVLASEHHAPYVKRHDRECLTTEGATAKPPTFSLDMHAFMIWRH